MSANLVQMLTGEEACRRERQSDVPDRRNKPVALSTDGRDLHATEQRRKLETDHQQGERVHWLYDEAVRSSQGLAKGGWRGNAKRADPTVTAADPAPMRNKSAKKLRRNAAPSACVSAPSACVQLQPRAAAPVAAPSASDAVPPDAFPPGALGALARASSRRACLARVRCRATVSETSWATDCNASRTAKGDSSSWLSRST